MSTAPVKFTLALAADTDAIVLTAMFMALGVEQARRNHERFSGEHFMAQVMDGLGQTGLMGELAPFATISEEILTEYRDREFPGVYEYEVSEPFGVWFATVCHRLGCVPGRESGERKLREMIARFFAQGSEVTSNPSVPRYTAETYTLSGWSQVNHGWCVKRGDDTVCEMTFGCGWPPAEIERRAKLFADALNANPEPV